MKVVAQCANEVEAKTIIAKLELSGIKAIMFSNEAEDENGGNQKIHQTLIIVDNKDFETAQKILEQKAN